MDVKSYKFTNFNINRKIILCSLIQSLVDKAFPTVLYSVINESRK